MEGNINNAIDQVAEYLGCTVDNVLQYLPQYIDKNIFQHQWSITIFSTLFVIFLITSIVFFIKAATNGFTKTEYVTGYYSGKPEKETHFVWQTNVFFVSSILTITALVLMMINIYELFLWINFPEVTSAEHILAGIK